MRFRLSAFQRTFLVLEEYDPELIYIKGPSNVVADALSRLDLLEDDEVPRASTAEVLAFNVEELSSDCYRI